MFAELTTSNYTSGSIAAMRDPFLPDLQIIADLNDEAFQFVDKPAKSLAAVKKASNVVQINQFVELVAKTPASDGGNLTDRIVSNAFQQHFCNELFDLLGGFVC